MSNKNLGQTLQDYGFTEEEAEVYLYLTTTGPCPARLVAQRFNTNRMKAYRTLKALEDKRLVDRIIGRPVKFMAAPLDEAIGRYLNDIKSRLSKLESNQDQVVQEWSSLSMDIPDRIEEPRFRVFQGRQQVYDLLLQMCNHVKNELRIVTTPSDLNRLSYMGFDDHLRELVSKGVNVSLMTHVDENCIKDIEYYQEFINVRHIEMQSAIRFVIIDTTETITSVSMDDSMSMTTQEDTGLWTDSSSFITAMNVFYQSLWTMAPNAETIIESLRSGTEPQEIKVINSMGEYLSTFQRMIEESQTTIDIMVRQITDLPLSLVDLIAVLTSKVKIRLLTHVDLDSFPDLGLIPQDIEILHNNSKTDLLLLVVDGKKTLFNVYEWEKMGQAVWSNLESYVLTMKQVFEDYWKNGLPLHETIIELRDEQNVESHIQVIADGFQLAGWQVESPGKVTGSNGTGYPFNIVCKKPSSVSNQVAIEFVRKIETFGEIIRFGTYSVNLKDHLIMLASLKPFSDKEAELSAIYNILLVHGENIEELAFRLIDHADRMKT